MNIYSATLPLIGFVVRTLAIDAHDFDTLAVQGEVAAILTSRSSRRKDIALLHCQTSRVDSTSNANPMEAPIEMVLLLRACSELLRAMPGLSIHSEVTLTLLLVAPGSPYSLNGRLVFGNSIRPLGKVMASESLAWLRGMRFHCSSYRSRMLLDWHRKTRRMSQYRWALYIRQSVLIKTMKSHTYVEHRGKHQRN